MKTGFIQIRYPCEIIPHTNKTCTRSELHNCSLFSFVIFFYLSLYFFFVYDRKVWAIIFLLRLESLSLHLYFLKSVKKFLWHCFLQFLFLKSSLMRCRMITLYILLRCTTEAYIIGNGHRDYDHTKKYFQEIELSVIRTYKQSEYVVPEISHNCLMDQTRGKSTWEYYNLIRHNTWRTWWLTPELARFSQTV